MADINQYLGNPGIKDPARFDRRAVVENFNWPGAMQRAQAMGIDLTDQHCEVVSFLRKYYLRHGWPAHAYELSRALDKAFFHKGGKRYLYGLFPGGPIEQASQIAALPMPASLEEHSQGTVQ